MCQSHHCTNVSKGKVASNNQCNTTPQHQHASTNINPSDTYSAFTSAFMFPFQYRIQGVQYGIHDRQYGQDGQLHNIKIQGCCLWIGQVSHPEHYLLFLRLWEALYVVTPLSVLTFTLFGMINITFPIVSCMDDSAPTGGLTFVVIRTLLPGSNWLGLDNSHFFCTACRLLIILACST